MSDVEDPPQDAPAKGSKKPMLIGLVLALAGAGGGFYATWSGAILAPSTEAADAHAEKADDHAPSPDVAYVPMEPLVVSLRQGAQSRHLKFRANLEVPPEAQPDVEKVLPRVVDVLNSYLRAVSPADIEDPAALTRLRAQMLRRVQVVTGTGKVNDLLIMEFVLT